MDNLSNDIRELFKNFPHNEFNSDWQQQIYNATGDNVIIQDQFATNTEKYNKKPSLKLSLVDGYDGNPVGSKGVKCTRNFFVFSEGHAFPSLNDLVRLCFFMHVDFYRTLLIAIKGDWEYYLAKARNFSANRGYQYSDAIANPTETEIRAFNPDIIKIYEHINSYFLMVKNSPATVSSTAELERLQQLYFNEYDAEHFDALVHEVLMENLMLHSINSPMVAQFANQQQEEKQLLKSGNQQQQEQYWLAKQQWLECKEQLSDLLLQVEEARLYNEHIQTLFMQTFGDLYLELFELIHQVELLQRRISLLEIDPDMSSEELEQSLAELIEQEQQKLAALRDQIDLAKISFYFKPGEGTGNVDDEQLAIYTREIKKVLFELHHLLHPERYIEPERKEIWDKLTDDQKKYLSQLWDRTINIKARLRRHNEGCVGFGLPALNELLDIKAKAMLILSHSGLVIEFDPDIKGNTIAEKLIWLDRNNKYLIAEIDRVKIERSYVALANDAQKRHTINQADDDKKAVYREKMQQEIDKLLIQIPALEVELAELLSERPTK